MNQWTDDSARRQGLALHLDGDGVDLSPGLEHGQVFQGGGALVVEAVLLQGADAGQWRQQDGRGQRRRLLPGGGDAARSKKESVRSNSVVSASGRAAGTERTG